MGSAMRIAALLGLSALVQANYPRFGNSSTTTNSTSPQPSLDCQPDNCLRQLENTQISSQVTAFCATYTTALITQTTSYPSFVSMCSGNTSRISSACSCAISGTPSRPASSTCQPNTVTVTYTPPFQTYTVTQNFTTTLLQPTTTTSDVYIPTTVTSDIYSNITQTEISTLTTTTEEETTATTTLEETETKTETATKTTPTTVTSVTTATITTSYPYTVITTVIDSTTSFITAYYPTTIFSVSTYDVTKTSDITVPTTTTAISVSDLNVTETVTATTVSTSDIYIDVPTTIEETQYITTSYPYTVIIDHETTTTSFYPTTVLSVTTFTDYVRVIVPTTTTSIVTSVVTTSYPVTTTLSYFTTLTDTVTGVPLTFTSYITQVSWVTTIATTSYSTTATETVPSYIPVTYTDHETKTDIEAVTYTRPASTVTTSILGSLTTIILPASTITDLVPSPTTITAPAKTTTLPGVTSVQIVTTILPGVVTTVTAAGIVTTTTLPGLTSVITKTVTLPGVRTTFPPVTVTVTNGIKTCPNPTPTSKAVSALPTDYTWGCPPGTVCHPPKPAGCDVFSGPPTDDYICQPSECVVSPPFTPVTAGWGDSIYSNDTSFFPLQEDYFNLSPLAFGLSFDIFVQVVEVLEVVGSDGAQTPTTVTTGDWASQTSITTQPTPVKKVKRSISRRSTTVPAPCYNECNNCYIEAQMTGKTSALCSTTSAFEQGLIACQACVVAHGDSTQQSLKGYVEPEFAQYINFCKGAAALSAVISSTNTPPQSEISTAPIVTPSVISKSQQAPATPTPPASTSSLTSTTTPAPASPTPAPSTSSTKPSSTSKPPPSATTSAVHFTGSSSPLYPPGISLLAFTTLLVAMVSVLI